MKNVYYCVALVLALVFVLAPDVQAQQEDISTRKLAQTGMKFLNFSVDPRAASLANALSAHDVGSSVSMFYNPAAMANMPTDFDLFLGQTQWIADISYNAASIAYSPAGGRYGVFGLNIVSIDYGEFIGTIRMGGVERGYVETGTFSPTAMAVGLGYARSLTDRFSVGGVVKLAIEDLGSAAMEVPDTGTQLSIPLGETSPREFQQEVVAFDFGVVYRTGFRSLNIAMRARNFSREVTYARENFELPLTFQIGASMNMLDLTDMDQTNNSFILSVDAERHRDYAEQVRIGGEYTFMNTLALRAGYAYPTDEQGVNLGVGLNTGVGGIGFGADYAYTQFGLFGAVHQVGLKLGF